MYFVPSAWESAENALEDASYYCIQRILSDSGSSKFDINVTANAEEGPVDVGYERCG